MALTIQLLVLESKAGLGGLIEGRWGRGGGIGLPAHGGQARFGLAQLAQFQGDRSGPLSTTLGLPLGSAHLIGTLLTLPLRLERQPLIHGRPTAAFVEQANQGIDDTLLLRATAFLTGRADG
jgi:hypothetical protein